MLDESSFQTSRSVRKLLLVGGLALLTSCGPAKNVAKREKPIANPQTSELTATGPVVADGHAVSTVSVVIRDQNGAAMPGVQPVISASGSGNVVHACALTDVNGASTCAVASTVAETKTINLSSPVALAGPTVEYVAGPATKLGFIARPSDSTSGQNFVRQPVVDIQDANGNRVPSGTQTITLAIAAGASGTLNGTKVLAASAGRAIYAGLNVGAISSTASVRLTASAAGLTSATSDAFTVSPDNGHTLAFNVQPGGGSAGTAWSTQPVVHILDSGGALLTSGTAAVTLTLTSGSGSLLGTSTVQAVGGVATFAGLKMEVVGTKQLSATSPGSANAVSNNFSVVHGAPSVITFSRQPGGGAADQVWSPQPIVRLTDAYGNLCVNSNDTIALSLQAGTGSLLGTTSLAAASGVATYTNLKMTVSGQKSIRATAGTLYVDSNAFMVTAGSAAVLRFATQPGGGTAGIAWTQQPVVEILDPQNNRVVSFSGTVGLALTTGAGTLSTSLAATSGIASFTGLKLNTAGTGKILTAAIPGVTGVTSAPFAIQHGAPAQLVVRTQPSSNDLANTSLSTQPALDLKDAFNNLITSGFDANGPVVASIYSGGGTVLGNSTLAFNAGQMSFVDLKVSTPGAKVLKFTKPNTAMLGGTGELTVNSNSFNAIVGAPAKLLFTTQSPGGVAGQVWATQPGVMISDTAGNRVTTASGTIAVALQSGAGTLLGTASASAVSGIATFTNLKMNEAGAKTLRASMGTLATDVSSSIQITHAPATQIVLTTQPGGATYSQNFTQQPVAQIRDSYGNVVTTGTDASAFVNASLHSGAGVLSGTASVTAVSGVATFTNLAIDEVGVKVLRLTKDDTSGLPGGTGAFLVDSAAFTVQAGTPTQLAVVIEPGQATAGQVFAQQPRVEIRDADGNLVAGSTAAVTVGLASGTGTLLGTKTVAATGGVVNFTNLQMNEAGAKTLQFTAVGLSPATSASYRVKAATASQMTFVTQPDGATVATAFTAQPVLQIKDLYGNVVEDGVDASANVTASLFSGTGTLSGLLTVTAASGVVTYSNLQLSTIGAKRIRLTKADNSGAGGASTLTSTSDIFTVSPGAGTALAFAVQPGGGTAGVLWTQQPRIEVRDANGNVDTSSNASVSLSLTTGSGSLAGASTVTAVSGVAVFTNLSLEAIGTDKVLTATAGGVGSTTSNAFTITAGAPIAASDLTISAGPRWSNDLDVYTVTATVRDTYGNPVAGKSVALSSSRAAADTIATSPTMSDANGQSQFTIRSKTGGTSVLTATINPGAVTVSTTVSAVFTDYKVAAAQSTWTQDRVSLAANGTTLLTVSGILRNAAGAVLPNKALTLTSTRGASDVIAPASATTDAGGQFSFTVKSATVGLARLTLNVPTDAVNVTTAGRAQFLALNPYAEYVPGLASADAQALFPGNNSAPVSTWLDVAAGGNVDGSLNGFAYDAATSGWMGDGNATISSGTTGPYRLGFTGASAVNLGTSLNSLATMSVESWIRPTSASTATRTIFANGEGVNGLTLRSARDGSGRLEGFIGARTYADEVIADTPSGYWRMNEASGTATVAAYGATNGTYAASPTLAQGGALASAETSVLFNGSTQWSNVGNVYNNSTSYTYEAWVYLPSAVATAPRAVIAKRSSAEGLVLGVNTSQSPAFTAYVGSTAFTATATTALATGTWYHLVGVRINQNCAGAGGSYSVRIYVNGVREACAEITGTPAANTVALRIGSDVTGGNGRSFPGRIDEAAVYAGKALSDARILAHYQARTTPVCHSSAALVNNNWTHVVLGYESNTFRLQVNGVETCNRPTSGQTISGSSLPFGIGASLQSNGSLVGGSEWSGAVGDVRVHDRGVNATDANTNYSTQSSQFPN